MMNRHNNQLVHTNSQHDLVNLIQETIRNELNSRQHSSQPTRSHNRRPRYDNYNNSQNNDYNNGYNRNEINGYTYILGIAALTLDYVPNSTGHRVNKVSTVLWSC
ncbi:hypothetical protein G6F21_013831 [Rhizopus arrhizus]|nr:hypothetical protein G6F21_013831 [Rhizopus arrhizus]